MRRGGGSIESRDVTLIAIIALGAGGLIVVLLAIAFPHVDPLDDEPIEMNPPTRLSRVTIRRSGTMAARGYPPTRRSTSEQLEAPRLRAVVPEQDLGEEAPTRARRPRRPPLRDSAEAPTASRPDLSHDLQYRPPWRRRRRFDQGRAGWVGAAVALSVALGYLIAHI
jgi:hypothetical protein